MRAMSSRPPSRTGAVVGGVPAVAEDDAVDEQLAPAAREQTVAVLDVRLDAQHRIEPARLDAHARRGTRAPWKYTGKPDEQIGRVQRASPSQRRAILGRHHRVPAGASMRSPLQNTASSPGCAARYARWNAETVGKGDVVGVVERDPVSAGVLQAEVPRRRQSAVRSPESRARGRRSGRGRPASRRWSRRPRPRPPRRRRSARARCRGSRPGRAHSCRWGSLPRRTAPAPAYPGRREGSS